MPVPDFQIYQIKVTLKRTKPPIWRRIQVRSNITLERLHLVLQRTMGWYNCHLHQYIIRGTYYGQPDPDFSRPIIHERKTKLDQVVLAAKTKIGYQYDFGDSWDHELLVEKILPPDPATHYPLCLGGKFACPPEDSGGTWGYYEKLAIMKDPKHPDHADIVAWMGKNFDPEAFDVKWANEALRET